MSKYIVKPSKYNFATELEAIERMVQECAANAVRDTRLAWKYGKKLSHSIDVNATLINKLIKCYQNSWFGHDLSLHYIKRVKDEFLSLVYNELRRSCHNQEHYDLILPIIFFRCIMVNEFNYDSAKTRQSRLEKDLHLLYSDSDEVLRDGIDNCCDCPDENDAWNNRKCKWEKNFDSPDVLSVTVYHLDDSAKKFTEVVSEAEEQAIRVNFKTNEFISLAVRVACEGIFPLKNIYKEIKECSEYSRAGCFLYDLLIESANEKQPLDTILRLYMIPEVHDVLTKTRHIISGRGYFPSKKDKQRPLSQYYAAKISSSTQSGAPLFTCITCQSDEAHNQTFRLLEETTVQKNKFMLFYKHLYTSYVFENIDILEFYLDKSILKPFIDMDKTLKRYANAVRILARELPHLEYADSHAQTAIRMTRLFREDQVLEAFKNSDDYATRQEVRELFGI